jgi:hypothetical protein
MEIKSAMIEITTNSSIKVNPRRAEAAIERFIVNPFAGKPGALLDAMMIACLFYSIYMQFVNIKSKTIV